MGFFRKADQPYLSLLISFIVLMLLPGLVEGQFWASRLFDLSLFAVLIFGALAAKPEKKLFLPLVALAALAIASKWGLWFLDDVRLTYIYLVSSGLFLTIILYVFARHVFLANKINANIIYGAVCFYLFLGTLMAVIYMGLEVLAPGAFSFPMDFVKSGSGFEWNQQLRELFYYSFVTQTTLGFGDITPVAPLARNLSILQAITGQFYIAILIARLIGLYLVQKK